MTTDDPLLTPGEAAAMLGITASRLQQLAAAGNVPVAMLTHGGQRRYRRSDIEAFRAIRNPQPAA